GSESEPPPYVPDGEQYFPLVIGRSITYTVDSIVFDDAPGGNTRDTISFQLREEIVGKVTTGAGDSAFVIHRFRRDDAAGPWILRDVYAALVAGAEALRTEENVTFVKMTFPLRPGNGWVSTAYVSPETVVQVGTENLE